MLSDILHNTEYLIQWVCQKLAKKSRLCILCIN